MNERDERSFLSHRLHGSFFIRYFASRTPPIYNGMSHRAAHPSITALLIILLVSMVSCAPHAERDRLRRAEALMESDARAARALLDSIDASSLRDRDRAHHAWLSVQIDYKNYVPLTTDSLALVATAYYGTPRRRSYSAAMAWYTLGCCYTDMNRTEDAFNAYLKARHCFPTTQSRYYSLCEQNIGKCYLKRCLYDDAIESFTHSRNVSVAIGDSTQIAWCDYFLGRCALYQENYLLADSLFDVAVSNPYSNNKIRHDCLFQKAKINFYGKHDSKQALDLLDKYRLTTDFGLLQGADLLLIGNVYYERNQLDSAFYYFTLGDKQKNELYTSNSLLYKQLLVRAKQSGDEDWIETLDHFIVLNDSVGSVRNAANMTNVRMSFQNELNKAALRHRYFVLFAALIFFLLFLVLVFLYLNNSRRKEYIKVSDGLKRAQMEKERQQLLLDKMSHEATLLQERYDDMCRQINENTSSSEESKLPDDAQSLSIQHRAEKLAEYRKRMEICSNQFKSGDSWKLASHFIHGGEHCLTNQERIAIMHDLNVCFTDFYAILSEEGKRLSQPEKMVSVCYYLNLNVDITEEILGISDASVRARKSRIKQKISPDLFDMIFCEIDANCLDNK